MTWRILQGNALYHLRELDAKSVQTCVTSPPYWGLRDYGADEQLGLEPTPQEYIGNLLDVFRDVRRVLRDDGTVWLNLGDSYAGGGCGSRDPERWPKQSRNDHMATHVKNRAGVKPKDLVGIPWRVALALRDDGWHLRSDIVWSKPNPMPESVTDRPTKSHEYLFLLSKSRSYFYDADSIREEHQLSSIDRIPRGRNEGHKWQDGGPGRHTLANDMSQALHPNGRNKRSVWEVATVPYAGAHFATFPPKLIEPCVLAGSAEGDTVLDPFCGSGTTGMVALRHGRKFVGIELNSEYVEMARRRIQDDAPLLNTGMEAPSSARSA